MADPKKIENAIRRVRNQKTFIQELLIDALGWDIDQRAQDVEDISFEWSAEELRANELDKHIVDGTIRQIRPFKGNPWGIFILEFKNPELFTASRGMTGTLRKVLRGLVPSKRKRSTLASFSNENLLFICNHDYKHYRFAHFKTNSNCGAGVSPARTAAGTAAPQSKTIAPLAAFGWGPDDPIRTLCEFNLNALEWPDKQPDAEGWVSAWSQAFDVEKVTKRFYEDYAAVFEKVEKLIGKEKEFKGDDLRMFTQTLFNRLMFLRFMERKDWLIFDGHKNYLHALYAAHCGAGVPPAKKSFYKARLCPLFFEGLAVEGKQQTEAYGNVPYLNGGLFEQSELDKQVTDLPDEVFAGILASEQAGGLFYRYNFTVEESTPLDIEVAVDPEMLGKVFEELVTGRHESGSYYTPRPVVSFMCREALKGYLSDKLVFACGAGVPPAQIGARTAAGTAAPQAAPQVQRVHEAVSALVDAHDVGKLKETQARDVLAALDDLKAVDPACGSGAYLLGLLQEMIIVYRLLYSEILMKDARTLYDLKLRIISQSLYGVDIDPFATNVAKLRLWLSLAVEADKPVPLPNLDFKIETGDSLLAPDPQELPDLFRVQLQRAADVLVMVKNQFFLSHGDEKESYRRTIISQESQLQKALATEHGEGVVDWRIQFAEAFANKRGGFDVVLANPPYGIDVQGHYAKQVSHRDSYACFLGLATSMSSKNAACVFIIPTSWETGERFTKFRRWFFEQNGIESVTNLPYDVFEIPFVDTCIVSFRPHRSTVRNERILVLSLPKRESGALDTILDRLQPLPVSSITADKSLRLILHADASGIFEKLGANPRLESVARIKRGIEAYQYTISPAQRGAAWMPYFEGTVYRYSTCPQADEAYVKPKEVDVEWHQGSRLVIRRLVSRANRLMAASMPIDAVVKKDLYVLKLRNPSKLPNLKYLLGLLNSSLYSYLYLARSASAQKDDFRQVSLAGLRDLPLPLEYRLEKEILKCVSQLERSGLSDKDRIALDQQLDDVVYDEFAISADFQNEIASFLASKG